MSKNILDYVMESPENTNPAVLGSLLDKENVQADWNQNDESARSYIRNRPFYTGDPVETVMLPETTVTIAAEESLISSSFPYSFEVGQTYVITFDGVDTEYTAYEAEGLVLIGYDYSSLSGGSGYAVSKINNLLTLITFDKSLIGSHTFSISRFAQEVVKIDPKYIRDMYYTGDPVETVLVEESTVTFVENRGLYTAQIQSNFEATVGETYKVYWDGAAYECTCVKFNNNPVIGNLSIVEAGSDTGEPFLVGIFKVGRIDIVTQNTSASHTFSISGLVTEVVKIDPKYLPDTIATKSDVDEKLGNCIKTVNGTAPDASGNVEVQTISEDVLSTNQYGNAIIVKNGVVFKNRLGQNTSMTIGESNVAFLVKEGKTSNVMDTIFAFVAANDADNGISSDAICLSRNGINFQSENVVIKSFKSAKHSVDVIQLNSSTSHGVMVEITKNACFVLSSSTPGSKKKFKITVDDSGTISATEVT